MLRCGGRQASRLISHRMTASASVPATGSGSNDHYLLVRHLQSRFVSSWFTPTPSPATSAAQGGGGASGNFGIATGLELEELEAQRKGRKRFDLEAPKGPFGTKSHPAIVESAFDERIVGCSGGVGEDEHDVIWFKLKKGEEYECPLCTQAFELKVVGDGGLPGAHH